MADDRMGELASQDIYPDERGFQPPPRREAELRSYEPTLYERIKGGASDIFAGWGADRYNANKMGDIAAMGASLFPPTGIPIAASEMQHSAKEGDAIGTVAASLGIIPGAGPIGKELKAGVKAARKMADVADVARYEMPAADAILPGDVRVSTRFPTAVKATEDPLAQHLSIGTKEMQASPGYAHNISLLQEYPGFAKLKGMTDDDAARAYVQQAADNLKYLYERSPATMKERSPLWYEGAHEISGALANRWDVPRPSASGALASLSPQMDWFKNASLGERVGDIMTSSAAGRILTPEMAGFADAAKFLDKPENKALYKSILGKSLDELENPLQKALWIRLYDEAHNPRAYRTITPEGRFGPYVLNQDGTPAKVGWGALGRNRKGCSIA